MADIIKQLAGLISKWRKEAGNFSPHFITSRVLREEHADELSAILTAHATETKKWVVVSENIAGNLHSIREYANKMGLAEYLICAQTYSGNSVALFKMPEEVYLKLKAEKKVL